MGAACSGGIPPLDPATEKRSPTNETELVTVISNKSKIPRDPTMPSLPPLPQQQSPIPNEIQRVVEGHFRTVLQLPSNAQIEPELNFFIAGGDSLSAIKLIAALRKSVANCKLSFQQLLDDPTVGGLSALLTRYSPTASPSSPPLPRPFPIELTPLEQLQSNLAVLGPGGGPTRMQALCMNPGKVGHSPLIFLNPAGASALAYRDLAREVAVLQPNTPIFSLDDGCILSPTGGSSSYPFASIEDVASEYEPVVAEVARLYSVGVAGGGGVALTGWSWGGTVASVLACLITRKHRAATSTTYVTALMIIDGFVTQCSRFEQYSKEGAGIILDTKRALAALPNSPAPPVDEGMVQRTVAHYAACTKLMRDFHQNRIAILNGKTRDIGSSDGTGTGTDTGDGTGDDTPLSCPLLDVRPKGLTEGSTELLDLSDSSHTHLAELTNPSHFTAILGPSAEEAARAMNDFMQMLPLHDPMFSSIPIPALTQETEGSELLEKWKTVWDETYHEDKEHSSGSSSGGGGNLDLSGWISSYTGKAIPVPEMIAWVEQTVRTVMSFQPRRVLEIGCGSGLLLLRIAPLVEKYTGIDFSQSVLDLLIKRIRAQKLSNNTYLICRAANQFSFPQEECSVDTVIINSVCQYFPSAQYLVDVLKGCVRTVQDGGQVFVGDVRTKSLLELQTVSVLAHQLLAKENLKRQKGSSSSTDAAVSSSSFPSSSEMLELVQLRIEAEEELMVDPGFFALLRQHCPEISSLEYFLKEDTAMYANEMSKFRYDVRIRVDRRERIASTTMSSPSAVKTVDAGEATFNLQQLVEELEQRALVPELVHEPVLVRNISNARLASDAALVTWLHDSSSSSTGEEGNKNTTLSVADFMSSLSSLPNASESPATTAANHLISPSELFALAASFNMGVHMIWSAEQPDRRMDALFFHLPVHASALPKTVASDEAFFWKGQTEYQDDIGFEQYTTNPLGRKMRPGDIVDSR